MSKSIEEVIKSIDTAFEATKNAEFDTRQEFEPITELMDFKELVEDFKENCSYSQVDSEAAASRVLTEDLKSVI